MNLLCTTSKLWKELLLSLLRFSLTYSFLSNNTLKDKYDKILDLRLTTCYIQVYSVT